MRNDQKYFLVDRVCTFWAWINDKVLLRNGRPTPYRNAILIVCKKAKMLLLQNVSKIDLIVYRNRVEMYGDFSSRAVEKGSIPEPFLDTEILSFNFQ